MNSTSRNTEKPRVARTALAPFPLVALALAALAAGVWGGLVRFGFLGTVVSLERAVALARRWGYLAPAGTFAGAGLLLAGVRQGIGRPVLSPAASPGRGVIAAADERTLAELWRLAERFPLPHPLCTATSPTCTP